MAEDLELNGKAQRTVHGYFRVVRQRADSTNVVLCYPSVLGWTAPPTVVRKPAKMWVSLSLPSVDDHWASIPYSDVFSLKPHPHLL
jgi:hypothetical protein